MNALRSAFLLQDRHASRSAVCHLHLNHLQHRFQKHRIIRQRLRDLRRNSRLKLLLPAVNDILLLRDIEVFQLGGEQLPVVLRHRRAGELVQHLNRRLRELQPGEPVTVTYFRPDDRKAGGAYLTVTTEFLGFDPIARCIRLTVATIPVSDLYGVE